MNNKWLYVSFVFLISFVLVALPLETQNAWASDKEPFRVEIDGNNLVNNNVIKDLKKEFYRVYPTLVSKYNHNAPRNVKIEIRKDKEVRKVGKDVFAYVYNKNTIVYSAKHLNEQQLTGVELLSHELMHVVQDPKGNIPSWLFEGMAAYAQLSHSPYFQEQYVQSPYKKNQTYEQGYEQAAIFLEWIKNKYNRPTLFEDLNRTIVDNSYNDQLFQKWTGKNIDQLWKEFKSDPNNLADFDKCRFRAEGDCGIHNPLNVMESKPRKESMKKDNPKGTKSAKTSKKSKAKSK